MPDDQLLKVKAYMNSDGSARSIFYSELFALNNLWMIGSYQFVFRIKFAVKDMLSWRESYPYPQNLLRYQTRMPDHGRVREEVGCRDAPQS